MNLGRRAKRKANSTIGKIYDITKKPKRARPASTFYISAKRTATKQNNPDMRSKEIVALLASQWKAVGMKDREQWQAFADKDRERYTKEMAAYVAHPV